jgi:hypothetical protein
VSSFFPFPLPLNTVYNKRNVSPEAPPDEQIPPGAIFETRSGHTIEIIGHKTPPGCNEGEGGIGEKI